MARWLSWVAFVALVGCSPELRDRSDLGGQFDAPGVQRPVSEPVRYVERRGARAYGLPRAGEPGIADLIALLPSEAIDAGESDLWAGPDDVPPCPDPDRVTVLDDLPLTVEAVVSIHPRQYLKVPVCDQDERNYGSFVVEDDTGGIVVLRNSRVAQYTAGDRVKLTVRAMMFTFRDPSTRVVVAADVERLDPPDGEPGVVLYERLEVPFSLADISETRRVEGRVLQKPTNTNFGQLVLASALPPAPDPEAGPGSAICRESCPTRCRRRQCGEGCAELCAAVCANGADGNSEIDEALPSCWPANVDQELQRRGFGPEKGTRLAIYGPVFNSFDIEMWVQRLGQVEVLDDEE